MRLEKIKLSGFKSFVDATTIPFNSDMVGIVGPNGCGKSNVIDAVRWVMGESSAKNLRGDQMADVIFNGSTTRKPVGQAFVELVFDNTDGAIVGEYAGNRQIALKRQVNREGQSTYFLNGTRCRRKDITDLFLGTGLGPRSYAIIEQGTISRLIEAKPDELRIFLEEAAGISKYKERRRDTENRMRRTRENLERVADLCEEIEKQCRHLKRQAGTAEKYKTLKQAERQVKAQLLALKWRSLNALDIEQSSKMQQLETTVESLLAAQRDLEKNLESQRENYDSQRERWNKVQADFYAIGSDIAKAEQALQHKKSELSQYQIRIEQSQSLIKNAELEQSQGSAKLQESEQQIQLTQQLVEEAKGQEHEAQTLLKEAEAVLVEWQKTWDDFTYQVAEPKRKIDVEKAKISQFERHLIQLSQRISSAKSEELRWRQVLAEDDEVAVELQHSALIKTQQEEITCIDSLQAEIARLRDTTHQENELLAKNRAEHARLSGRLASIELLQESSLGDTHEKVEKWLGDSGLSGALKLVENLNVKSGWELAVEVVLGAHLQAVCVEDFANVMDGLKALENGQVTLLDKNRAKAFGGSKQVATELANLIDSEVVPASFFSGIHYAETMQQAQQLMLSLNNWESVITKQGVWLRSDSVSFKSAGKQGGALSLEKEKKSILAGLKELSVIIESCEAALSAAQTGLSASEKDRQHKRQNEMELAQQLSKLTLQMAETKSKKNQAVQRLTAIEEELRIASDEKQQDELLLSNSKQLLETTINDASDLEQQREHLQQQRNQSKAELDAARVKLQSIRDQTHEHMLVLEAHRSSRALTAQNLSSVEQRKAQSMALLEEARELLSRSGEPLEQQKVELDSLLHNKIKVEATLAEERRLVDQCEESIRQIEASRNNSEQEVQAARENITSAKVNHQEVLVRKQTLVEQLQDSNIDLKETLDALDENAKEGVYQVEMNELQAKIERLGAINLTAIEEFETQSERKTYLDSQQKDLTDALETLNSAIEKIDKESRVLFKQTFDKVNAGFERRFPKLFGGGNAYLQLTGGDILETGVTVMARPPGKRNSSIHLLSGGEKALTAVALVFAIFDLNPAPFCMLDEVDAPLDEANVGRFGELVKEMSKQVQIILITHNKSTMEIAKQLSGVTMKEPGVSRIVSVDIEEAAQMVAS